MEFYLQKSFLKIKKIFITEQSNQGNIASHTNNRYFKYRSREDRLIHAPPSFLEISLNFGYNQCFEP